MKYISTRGGYDQQPASFCDILLEGLAPDGGLYVPSSYPRVGRETLGEWRSALQKHGYPELAYRVLELFIDDIPGSDLRGICERAYTEEKFGDPAIVGVDDLGGGLLLGHLSNGPTAAFKDMAMQLLGELFAYELERRDTTLTVLGATSGDTGSAAEYAMLGHDRVSVFMLTPQGRMSPFQQAQMFSLDDPAIVNVAVDGVFDDCQDLVKAVNSDLEFKARYRIGAVNSINWARLVAQVVYYVALWLHATVGDDERVSFAVPSGNFGNICAGHVAREMGLPIDTLVLATNENNVLDEFFRTGRYRVRSSEDTFETSSPSMDISKASNFERFVFDLLGRDANRIEQLFGERLTRDGEFDLSDTTEFDEVRKRFGFVSGSSSHADRIEMIRETDLGAGRVIDPHTADGVKVARDLLAEGDPMVTPVIVLETALPVKFSETIIEALGRDVGRPERFRGIEELPRHVVSLPNDVSAVKDLIEERNRVPSGVVGGEVLMPGTASEGEFTFRPVRESDLPTVVRWQRSPAAAPWFAGGLSLEQAEFRYGPRLSGEGPIRMFIVSRSGREIGYAQAYRLSDLPDSSLIPAPSEALGIDFLIGESDLVGRGIGPRLIVAVAEFARWLFPGAGTVVACPDHRNRASCRALEKAGFNAGLWFDAPNTLGEIHTTAIVYTRVWT